MATTAFTTIENIGLNLSPIDFLWKFYKAQTSQVKKEFRLRLENETIFDDDFSDIEPLTPEQRKTAFAFVEAIKRRIADVEYAKNNGKQLRKAEDFLTELQNESV